MAKKFQNFLVAMTFVAASCFSLPCLAGEWQKPWPSVQGESVRSCEKTFADFQLQAVCMENEKDGYEKMQSNFGLPDDIAEKAKERCEKTFHDFQLQAVCMQNEKEGYEKMKRYRN